MKDKIIKKIKNINWHVFHKRLRSPFFHHLFLLGTGIKKQDIPFDNRVRYLGSFLNHVAIDEAEIKKLCDRVVRHLKKNPNYLLELMQQFYNEQEKCIKEWKKIATKSFTKESNEGLAKILETYAHQLLSFGIYVTLPLFVEGYLEQTLMNAFTKRFGNKAKYWFNIAVDPIKDASVLQEELALLGLAQKASITKKELKKHAERFGWMKNVGYFEDYYDIDYYRSRLEEMRKNNPKARENKILTERAQHKEEFKKLTKTIAEDPYLLAIIKTANEAVYFRSYRTEIYYSSARFFTRLFKEIAKRLSIPNYKDILWLYWDEIYISLRNNTKADINIIEERKQGYAFMEDYDGKYWNWKGKEKKEVFKAFQQSQELKIKGMKELKGSSAFPGKIKGKVVVVLSADQQNKVQKGDILVTHATNVNFVPILNKVSAIVTEEGGILSHAAIISRELKIPCVIGTKIATKVLKDGDLVEVDADKGVVRILGKTKNIKLIKSIKNES